MIHRAEGPPNPRRPRGRVLAVDDQATFLSAMRDVLDATGGLEAVAEAGSAEQAIDLVRELEPDMVLMDVWMSGMDGIAAAREIKALRPATVVVLTSTTHPDELSLGAEDIRADAVVWKCDLEPRLLDEIWLRSGDSRGESAC